jgi:hypothetical protein
VGTVHNLTQMCRDKAISSERSKSNRATGRCVVRPRSQPGGAS